MPAALDLERCAYALWEPRRDQPERYDEQTAFYESQHPGVTFLVGGNGAGTTECALAKVADFVMCRQAPPRRDTPFWIISNSYETVCDTAWKEKLRGHGHIPDEMIELDRIKWHSETQDWPFRVPLKPWRGRPGRNWCLEFKSYEQGRQMMQARSIGGFLFIEQFPWVLLTEVLRGCREYDFTGNKLAEFTPVEPGLTEDLEQMMMDDELPDGWAVYRANTQCAMEAGHVSAEWFQEFFGMVPEEMRETRMTGAWPSYEGVIYPNFNPRVHCVDMTSRSFPVGAIYRRSIDWGSGPDNPFACLWAFKIGAGQWCIFDEYYSNDINKSVIDHLKEVSDRWPWPVNNGCYGTTWADPSGQAYFRIASRLSEYAPGYANMNISAASNQVIPGIEHVQHMMAPRAGLISPFDDEPREHGCPSLLICSVNCKNLMRELRGYRWLKSSKNGVNPKDAKPEPLKKADHLADALRYLCFSEAKFGVKGHTQIVKEIQTIEHGIQLKRQSQARDNRTASLNGHRNRGVGYGG